MLRNRLQGSSGAAAGALLLRHTVIVHRHQELGIPLQTDDGELPQSDVDPAAVVAAAKLPAEALADGRRAPHTDRSRSPVGCNRSPRAGRPERWGPQPPQRPRVDSSRRSMGISGSPERQTWRRRSWRCPRCRTGWPACQRRTGPPPSPVRGSWYRPAGSRRRKTAYPPCRSPD